MTNTAIDTRSPNLVLKRGWQSRATVLSQIDQTIAGICRIEAEQNRPGEKERGREGEGEGESERGRERKKRERERSPYKEATASASTNWRKR